MREILVFDVWSSFGYFRRGYTTSTATTFPFIPRSAVEGLIAAIIGMESEIYPERLESARIAVGVLNNVSKIPISLTYTHSDFWQNVGKYLRHGRGPLPYVRAPRKAEFLREPKYRIYLSSSDRQLINNLKERLEKHHAMFTPYLGTSSMIANFNFVGVGNYTELAESEVRDPTPVSTIVPYFEKRPPIYVQKGVRYAFEQNLPLHITVNRETTKFYSAVYSPNGDKDVLVSDIPIQKVRLFDGRVVYIAFIPTVGSS